MTETYRIVTMENAIQQRDTARRCYDAAKVGSREWKAAANELEFWSSKVAFLAAPAK